MKYRKGQLVRFDRWVGLNPSLLKPSVRAFRKNVKVDLEKGVSLGVVVEIIPLMKAWHAAAAGHSPKNCYIVYWQGQNAKKLMYESELTKSN